MKDYLGEKQTLYFAFLGTNTQWMLPLGTNPLDIITSHTHTRMRARAHTHTHNKYR